MDTTEVIPLEDVDNSNLTDENKLEMRKNVAAHNETVYKSRYEDGKQGIVTAYNSGQYSYDTAVNAVVSLARQTGQDVDAATAELKALIDNTSFNNNLARIMSVFKNEYGDIDETDLIQKNARQNADISFSAAVKKDWDGGKDLSKYTEEYIRGQARQYRMSADSPIGRNATESIRNRALGSGINFKQKNGGLSYEGDKSKILELHYLYATALDNRRNIEETIKSTKPTKFRKQRYTYEDNKFFAELRDILKMSRAEALRAQEAFAGQIGLARADGEVPLGINISEYDRLKNLLYYYKINGAESSLAALQDLATSLEELKAAAADKRLDEDTLKSEVRKKDKDELLEGINKYKASNIFARGMAKIGTIRSAMSEYFGKEMADKWNLESAFERVNIFMRSRIKPVMDSAREIYGAAKASDFLNLMQNKSQKEFELTDNDGDYDKLSIMDIADIYIGMKDPNTRANYYAAYEKFDDTMPTDRGQLRAAIETMSDEQLREHMLTNNLGTLLSYLSEQDMRFGLK